MSEIKSLVTAEAVKDVLRSEEVRSVLKQQLRQNLEARLDAEGKRLTRTVLIFTESSDQLSRATDRVPGLPASPGYAQ